MKRMVCVLFVSLFVFTSCKKSNNPIYSGDETATVTYAGKVYHTVKIGNQTWLKENLDVGVMIDSLQNPSNNGTIEKYCYNNDTANCTKYGGLYQWDEVMAYDTANSARGICPTGWHIPTKEEYETLSILVKGDGNALKVVGDITGNGAETDSSGFSALLAGFRYASGSFYDLGSNTHFWSSTEYSTKTAYDLGLWFNNIYIYLYIDNNGTSFSIRCLKD